MRDLKKEYFLIDKPLQEKLSKIPRGEKSVVIRMALRDYFGLSNSKKGEVWYTEDDIETAIERGNENGFSQGSEDYSEEF